MKKTQFKAAPSPATPPAHVAPVLQLLSCPACTRTVPLLVEGSDLCMRCDARHFPELVIA